MCDREPEWRATAGYTINEESGFAEKCQDMACTLHFYLANPGDILHLRNPQYMYAVATYRPEADPRYIFTYDYQTEENWTKYRCDFSATKFGQEDYVFTERVYFRIVMRRTVCESPFGGPGAKVLPKLDDILLWKKAEAPGTLSLAQGEAWVKQKLEEAALTARTVAERQTEDALNFFLMTDSHYTVNGTWEDTLYNLHQTLDAIKAYGIKMDGFLHLGDVTDGMVQAEITRDYVSAVLEDIRCMGLPLHYVIGNHDSNYFRNNPERFSQDEIERLYLRERGKCYYYVDYPGHNLS